MVAFFIAGFVMMIVVSTLGETPPREEHKNKGELIPGSVLRQGLEYIGTYDTGIINGEISKYRCRVRVYKTQSGKKYAEKDSWDMCLLRNKMIPTGSKFERLEDGEYDNIVESWKEIDYAGE
jgi:hypothetical protein